MFSFSLQLISSNSRSKFTIMAHLSFSIYQVSCFPKCNIVQNHSQINTLFSFSLWFSLHRTISHTISHINSVLWDKSVLSHKIEVKEVKIHDFSLEQGWIRIWTIFPSIDLLNYSKKRYKKNHLLT